MRSPIRVLHVVGSMNRGGVESWLMALLRHADRSEIAMDFLVHVPHRGAYDDEIAARGARVIVCPSVHGAGYFRDFDAALERYGPYDVLHSHVHWFSGLTTTFARRRRVRLRIAHSHSDTSREEAASGFLRGAYRALMRRAIFSSATHLLAASQPAARALFGSDSRASVVYCGVDLAPFSPGNHGEDRESARREFGIGPEETVIGHVGGFRVPKNHAFLCDVATRASSHGKSVHVLCAGNGPLESAVKAQVEQAGLRATFCGLRSDVPRLLRAMDVFVFPSLYEGLPLAVLEAQAAGLPCVVSAEVTREADVGAGLIHWLRLEDGAAAWAEAALNAATQQPRPYQGLAAIRRSPFSVESSFARMHSIYHG